MRSRPEIGRLVALAAVGVAALGVLPLGCASHHGLRGRHATPQELVDTLVAAGRLDSASALLQHLADSLSGTPEGGQAAYQHAYLNVFSGNASPRWMAALAELKRFVEKYPGHPREEEANTWIRMLSAFQYLEARPEAEVADSLLSMTEALAKMTVMRDSLATAVGRCTATKDSLAGRVKLLDEVIETIERAR
jgi:hypothetical protein